MAAWCGGVGWVLCCWCGCCICGCWWCRAGCWVYWLAGGVVPAAGR
ncbi:hypothetical protein [Prevotella melaninogenica]|nr:hypothetical protein [Prevotella melaninogenica]QUB66926.1 hypothetical protein J5A57_08960 [Prevotella melaninogenica]